jgi:hypothetical protein
MAGAVIIGTLGEYIARKRFEIKNPELWTRALEKGDTENGK